MDNKYEEEIEILDIFDDEEENTVEEPVKEEVKPEVQVEETPVYEATNNYENVETTFENDSSDDDILQGVDIPDFDPEENVDQPTEVEEPFFGYNFSQNNEAEPQVNNEPLVSENISINDQLNEKPVEDVFSFDFNNNYQAEQTDFSGNIDETPVFEENNGQPTEVEEPTVSEELNYASQDTEESVVDDLNVNDQFVESNEPVENNIENTVENNIENTVENETTESEDSVVANIDDNETTTDNVEQVEETEDNEEELKLKNKKNKKKTEPKTVLFVLLLILLIVAFAVLAPSLIESFM